jgi:Uma2 family endonuclease
MKAVMSKVPEDILAYRRRSGADRWDEMWEGVLHMAPSPNRDHQDIEFELERWLRHFWAEPNGHRVYHQINVAEPGAWPNNYRVPDLVLLTKERAHIDRNEYFDGGPDAVVEIHSPGDETYEKFEFYAKVGVREVWVVDRDTCRPEIYALNEGRYVERNAVADGWLQSEVAGTELRGTDEGDMEIRLTGRDETRERIP